MRRSHNPAPEAPHAPSRARDTSGAAEPLSRTKTSDNALRAALTVTALVFAVNLWLYRDYLIDDTFISLRYARNLAEGYGLVFNPGEYVEGYTNFSFVLISSLCFLVGVSPILVTRVLSFAAAVIVLILLSRLESLGPHGKRRTLAPWFLIAGPAFAYWAVASFETMPFTALLLGALWLQWGESVSGCGHRSAIVWIALALTRPEGLYLFAIASLSFAVAERLDGKPLATTVHRHATHGLIVTGAIAPHVAWRWWYYGSLVPNTFYAKVTGGGEQLRTGLNGFGLWLTAYPAQAIAAIVVLAVATRRGRNLARRHPYALAIAIVAFAQTAYVVAIGGDFMPYFRFYQPILPLTSLILAWASTVAIGRVPRARVALPLAILVIGLVASHATTQRLVAFVSHRTTLNGIRVGKLFAGEIPAGEWIAVNTAGAIPFYSRLPSIDMLGLTDATIASRQVYIVSTGWAGHRKGWGRYVLARRPKRILWYNTAGAREPFYLGDHELAENPYFRFFYSLTTRRLPAYDSERPLAWFLGTPFGDSPGRTPSPQLGFAAVTDHRWIATSTLYESQLVVHAFDRDDDLRDLWPASVAPPGDVTSLVDAAVRYWRERRAASTANPTARYEIETICDQAQQAIEHGDVATAKRLLAGAAAMNQQVRSPLVYQYIANVAVLAGEPFVAIAAQKEALRLRPENQLYRSNLTALLSVPYEELASADRLGQPGETAIADR